MSEFLFFSFDEKKIAFSPAIQAIKLVWPYSLERRGKKHCQYVKMMINVNGPSGNYMYGFFCKPFGLQK
jgi:hypothetical protein